MQLQLLFIIQLKAYFRQPSVHSIRFWDFCKVIRGFVSKFDDKVCKLYNYIIGFSFKMFELINANSYTALRMRFEPIEPKQVDDDLLIFHNSHCYVLN